MFNTKPLQVRLSTMSHKSSFTGKLANIQPFKTRETRSEDLLLRSTHYNLNFDSRYDIYKSHWSADTFNAGCTKAFPHMQDI